jgi:glycosyltransferase involved in cell wall biosynthesis
VKLRVSPTKEGIILGQAARSQLKVLHVGKFYPPHMGGIETHLQALCRELSKSVRVRVVVANDAQTLSEELLDGVPLVRVPTRFTVASTPVCPGMIRQIQQSDDDIIHIHLPNPMAVMAYLASGHRGRLIVTYHSDTIRQKLLGTLFEPFLHRAMRRSSVVIATSPNYRRTSRVLGLYSDRCQVVPYGIELDEFEHCDPVAVGKLRQQYGDRVVISVGRLVYYKGFEHLIRAMEEVSGKLLIVGDGPLRGQLETLAQKLNVTDRVIFAGEVQNTAVVPYYHASDVFALASVARSEAFGIVQIEAMAAGLPVINTGLDSGVPYVSLHNETGITVPPANSRAMAAAINQLLDNRALRLQLGQAGRLRAREEFSLKTMTQRTLALYANSFAGNALGPFEPAGRNRE